MTSAPRPTDAPDLLTEAEAAHILAVTSVLLTKWRHLKRGPPYYKMEGGSIRYAKEAILQWLQNQEVQP